MANPPTTITITYVSQLPNVTSQSSLSIPAGSTYDQMVTNIRMNRGFWLSGTFTFIPYQQIVSITAQ